MRRYLLCLSVLSSVGAADVASAAQAATDCGVFRIGWSLEAPRDGELGDLYWATTNYTEVWTTFRPIQATRGQQGVPDILLVFSVCFKGKTLPIPQRSVEVRFQLNRNFIPSPFLVPRVEMVIDGATRRELTSAAFKSWIEYPNGCAAGDGCTHSAILVEVPVQELRRWAMARGFAGNASGTPFELSSTQRQQLGRFLDHISGERQSVR